MDTVPPFFPSREDDDFIWGRGSADAKGIIASMIVAAEGLLADGVRNFGLLFVVGEERNSAGAYAAAKDPRGSRYLINGEPTENKLAAGHQGRAALRNHRAGQAGSFRLSRIWANPPSKSCSTRSNASAAWRCPPIRCSAEHAQHRRHLRRPRAQRHSR